MKRHLDLELLFNTEITLSNLVTRSSEVYNFDNIFELSYQLGSALSSVYYNLVSSLAEDNEETLVFNQMLEVFVDGFNTKYSTLRDKDSKKIIIISSSNKVH